MRRCFKALLPKTLFGRLVLGTGVGWSVLVIAILWVSLRGSSGLAEEVRHVVSELSVLRKDKRYRVTASLGISCLGVDDVDAQAMVKRADAASYDATAQGKNRMMNDARCL